MNINWMVDLWLAHLHLVHLPIENQHKSTIDGPWLQPAGFPSFDHLKTPNISKNHPQFLGLYSSSIQHQQLICFFLMSCAFTIFTRKHDFVLILWYNTVSSCKLHVGLKASSAAAAAYLCTLPTAMEGGCGPSMFVPWNLSHYSF